MSKNRRFAFSFEQFEKLIEQGSNMQQEISDKDKDKEEKKTDLTAAKSRPLENEERELIQDRSLEAKKAEQPKPVVKKAQPPKVIKSEKKKPKPDVPKGLLPYLAMLDFSNLLEFTNSLESQAHTLEWDTVNGHLPNDQKLPEATADADAMYSHYVNKDRQATVSIGLNGLTDDKEDWGNKFLIDIAKQMKPPLRMSSWFWGGTHPDVRDEEHLGRFYLSVYHPFALDFWEELFYIKQELRMADIDIYYKMTDRFESLKRGDCSVVYFDTGSQLRVYNLLAEMIEKYVIWFKENIPMFTAQMLDNHGQPLRGLSFGQNPATHSSSFGYQRALALSAACGDIREKVATGQHVSKEKAYMIVASHLKIRNVDVDNPAFNIGGTTLFSTIFRFTDQFRRQNPH